MPTQAKSKKEAVEPRKTSSPEEPERVRAHESEQHLVVHTLNATLPIPYFTPGDLANNTRTVTGWLPSPGPAKDLVYYGGLGALAVAGALEWPVALAVAGATWVIRSRQEGRTGHPGVAHEPEGVSGGRGSGLS
ncbi:MULTISPECIES: hypothetical protein [unclassified Streptomyces]|uniref:hypothetical protein n=1 Tax=unclassified Streptomyces TaxID=2593676 RepID=UPI000DBA0121|nr:MULTISPECIES: hypothetical protein [unclassified Streptomyces]MYT75819.1 hypothetical protein [Streptomyces sp. SID8367]RAJ77645.1 hypothetical protein K377_05567 [Streptomyces sp. PsTaAH-137]